MKIGILTQPLSVNYGGLLQAYALQSTLRSMGHKVWTIDLPFRKTLYSVTKNLISRVLRKYLLGQKEIGLIFPLKPTKQEFDIISKNTNKFITENIQITEKINIDKIGKNLNKYNFDAIIVGSDQVWRPCYSPRIKTYYLDFLKENNKVKRIAFAASFGVDYWEYNERLTRSCSRLAQSFDAISVREDSGLKLCSKYLNINAQHVVDPTLLLNPKDYLSLINKKITQKNILLSYLLDNTKQKNDFVQRIADKKGLIINNIMPEVRFSNDKRRNLSDIVLPSVQIWLKGFIEAKFVVTDSFHGTVFSIIFNKPFLVIGNQDRGLSRFTSLLSLFGLEKRLIVSINDLAKDIIEAPINFGNVNKIIKEQQKIAIDFLNKNLKV